MTNTGKSSEHLNVINSVLSLAYNLESYPNHLFEAGYKISRIEPRFNVNGTLEPDIIFMSNDRGLICECKTGEYFIGNNVRRYREITIRHLVEKGIDVPKENLDLETKYCCYKDGTEYKAVIVKDESDCTNGRIIYKAKKDDDDNSKNTGHVLFIHDLPYRSTEKKDCTGTYQWVVEVADSTTSPHMFDSRKKGEDNSFYGPNYYHAWTKGDEGYVQRCCDGSYHRDCTQHNTSQAGGDIEIDTSGDHATGIGVGKMYINDNMSGYRVNYSHKTEYAEVMIGRPVPCEQ